MCYSKLISAIVPLYAKIISLTLVYLSRTIHRVLLQNNSTDLKKVIQIAKKNSESTISDYLNLTIQHTFMEVAC